MQRKAVKSSMLKEVGYDPEKQLLEVQYHNGGVYQHPNFPPEKWADFQRQEKIGAWFAANVRGHKDHPAKKMEAESAKTDQKG